MSSPCIRDASEACFHGCSPFAGFPGAPAEKSVTGAAAFRHDFLIATSSSLHPNSQFTNHESLPSLHESFSLFASAFPQYEQTDKADELRANEYHHLSSAKHVCLDYTGHGLFSYSQQIDHLPATSIASSSSHPPLSHSSSLESPFLEISYKSVNLSSQIVHGVQESEIESRIRKRIMAFMNVSETDYAMFFTANQLSAFKLLAESYSFHSNADLLTVYDHENEAVELMLESARKRGAHIRSAEFLYPRMRIRSEKLRKMIIGSKRNRRRRGLFVFPLQSRATGAQYSYSWIGMAQEKGWHVLLDASALRPKDMDTLGLSLFKPDFLICSFYKVFGDNPSGFACLFVKKSSASILRDSDAARSIGIVSLTPVTTPFRLLQESAQEGISQRSNSGLLRLPKNDIVSGMAPKEMYYGSLELHSSEVDNVAPEVVSSTEIEEIETPFNSARSRITETSFDGSLEIEFRGLDHADKLGIILINCRARCLINWLVNALLSLKHPDSDTVLLPLVTIYGPKVKLERGPMVAFNVFDWKGEKIDPLLVQKLADRNNISLTCGFLQHLSFSDKYKEWERTLETRTSVAKGTESRRKRDDRCGISVVTASLGFLTNFEDVYRLWAFISRFLDADFVEKERWRYTALNQETVEEALEAHDGVSKGKYTIGLGQDCLAFCTEVEDVVSMSLTAVTSLLEKYGIDPKQIGRLEVGSETVIDKSKSIKTFLMPIFEASGNTDVEGVDSTNACYGGTAALFNCVNWVESSSWDGRYGLVVCTDSAVYAEGPARPTGGAAAIAMLIGPDAPVVFESKFRGSHMSHAYDFYKPNLASEYPVVDGKLSQTCYLMALDSCYKHFCHRFEKIEAKQFSISDAAYFVFHSPYNKLVQKSFARVVFNDYLRNASSIDELSKEKLAPFSSLSGDESYSSRDLEKVSQQVARPLYDEKVQPTTLIPKQIGNMYTASLYAAFASLIHNKHTTLGGKRIILFSYGSGLTATMFSLRFHDGQNPFSLSNMAAVMDVEKKLKSRHEFPPEKFVETMKLMEHRYGARDFATSKDCSLLSPGTYYLTEVDSMYRRFYAKKTKDGSCDKSLASH